MSLIYGVILIYVKFSILQHSWAEIEHDLGYKGESEIPSTAKRTFFRVAALLEQADIEFVKLKAQIQKHEKEIEIQIEHDSSQVLIDKSSLLSVLRDSGYIRKFEAYIASEINMKPSIEDYDYIVTAVLPRLQKLGITSIKDLERCYTESTSSMEIYIKTVVRSYKKEDLRHRETPATGFCRRCPPVSHLTAFLQFYSNR